MPTLTEIPNLFNVPARYPPDFAARIRVAPKDKLKLSCSGALVLLGLRVSDEKMS